MTEISILAVSAADKIRAVDDLINDLRSERARIAQAANQQFIPCKFRLVKEDGVIEVEAELDITRGIVLKIERIDEDQFQRVSFFECEAGGVIMRLGMGEFGEYYVIEPHKLRLLGNMPQPPFTMSQFAKKADLDDASLLYLADPYTKYRQRATMIAALRYYLDNAIPFSYTEIASNEGKVIPLFEDEIEVLIKAIEGGAL